MAKVVVRDGFVSTDDHPGVSFVGDPGLTDHSQAKDCDVNVIVDRFMKTGVLPGVDVERVYGDFSDPIEYHDAMGIIAHAQEQFDSLDAKVRKRFSNDPSEFLAFANDPNNASEMVQLGLATLASPPPSQPLPADSRASGEASKSPPARADGESPKPVKE